MRRRIAAVAAVLVGSAAAGVGAAALPARAVVTAGHPGSASAASEPSVTIRAIDREGKAVAVTASLQSANSANAETLTSAHATEVPAGSYIIAAWVWEPTKKAATLVDRAITITSSQTVTFDARRSTLVRFTVNDSTVSTNGELAQLFSPATGNAMLSNDQDAPNGGTATYLVPGPLPAGWDLLLQANLVRHEPAYTASPVEYELVKILSGSVPSNLTFASTRAGLAQDHLTVRDIGQGTDGVVFSPSEYGDGSSYGQLLSAELGQDNIQTPASVDVFFSPGYEWESVSFAANNDVRGTHPLLAGHTYAQTFNAAVFSPSPILGPGVSGSTLYLTESLGNSLLVDAANQGPGTESVGLYPTAPQGWLYEGTKLIAHASGYNANFSAKIPATMQTYTLKLETTRVASGTPVNGIAKSVTATYTFEAKAGYTQLPNTNFWPRMVPEGVSEKNTAAGGSKTTVPITFDNLSGAIAAEDVAVWASANGGKTWTPLRVTHSGNTWTVTVNNPRQAGYVSLRVQGEDTDTRFKATVTAINAYAVS